MVPGARHVAPELMSQGYPWHDDARRRRHEGGSSPTIGPGTSLTALPDEPQTPVMAG
jgi:hypothetical protein